MSKNKRSVNDLKQEEVLQAVVLADSFDFRFSPITRSAPRVLLPLVSIPMLDYTLEALENADFEEVIVFCSYHAKAIEKHLERWQTKASFTLIVLTLKGCFSLGDAMRDIDNRNLLRSDFVLIFGDLVTNLKLDELIEVHKRTREKDKTAVLTMVMTEVSASHPSRHYDNDYLTVISRNDNRVRHFQKAAHEFKIPSAVAKDEVNILFGLLDSHICICSPVIPQMFIDDFDFQTRDDLIRGVLINEEIMGKSIYLHVPHEGYACRVVNPQLYSTVSLDIMRRWSYPYVPELFMPTLTSNNEVYPVSYRSCNVYQAKNVLLERGCKLLKNVFVGENTTIDSGSVISDSVIGNNCSIGKNVKITGAYLWDNVKISDNCIIDKSILCGDVQLKSQVIVKNNCILSWGVIVGDNSKQVVLKEQTQLIRAEDADEESDQTPDTDKYGSTTNAITYDNTDNDDGYDEEDETFTKDEWGIKILGPEPEDGEDSDDDVYSDIEEVETNAYYPELIDTMKRAEDMNTSPENLILEINSLKHSYNISIKEVNQTVMQAIVEMPLQKLQSDNTKEIAKVVLANINLKHPVLENYIQTSESQRDCLEILETISAKENKIASILVVLLQLLYDNEILEEEVITKWFDDLTDNKVKQKVAPLIKWFEVAEEEDD